MNLSRKLPTFIEVLGTGRRKARDARFIADALGLSRGRTAEFIRELARLANANGIPVCSCSKGFFLAETQGELDDYVANLFSREHGLRCRIIDLRKINVEEYHESKHQAR
jgi:hypothetical protein